MVIGIEGRAPADDAALLSAPVDTIGRHIGLDIQTDLLQLLCRDHCHVDTNLIAGSCVDGEGDTLAAPAPVAIRILHAAGSLQNGNRLGRIVVVLLNAVIVILVHLDGAVGNLTAAQQDSIQNCLTINGVVDCGDQIGIFLPVGIPEVVQNAAIVSGFHVINSQLIHAIEGLSVLGSNLGKIQLTILQLQSLGSIVGDDLKDDGVNVGSAAKVILVLHHNDGLAHFPVAELIGASADRRLEVVGAPHILALQQVLGNDGHGHVIQESVVRLAQNERDLGVADNLDFSDLFIVGGILRAIVGILDSGDGESYVLSGERLTIMPFHIVTELEGVSHACLIIAPALCQTGNQISVTITDQQAVEQQVLDLAVLIHNGVDGVVVAGAIDQGGFLRGGCIGIRRGGLTLRLGCLNSGRGLLCAAGSQAQEHSRAQQESKNLFCIHTFFPFLFRQDNVYCSCLPYIMR